MKVLSLTQPWATLVALGAKQIETRSWSTNYRGPLAIHAAKGFPRWAQDICDTNVVKRAIGDSHSLLPLRARIASLPLGCIIAVVDLVDIRRTEDIVKVFRHRGGYSTLDGWPLLTPEEEQFGDYGENRFGWLLRNVRRIEPIPAKGALGLWEYPRLLSAEVIPPQEVKS